MNKDDLKNPKCKLSQEEITILRGILGKLNWVARMTRPEISFFVKLVNDSLNIKLYSDASFNNLPNSGSQGGTAQLHSTKPELRFCACSNPACSMLEIRDGEDL